MKNRFGQPTLFAVLLLSSVSLPGLAHAQSSTVPMPIRTFIDDNGVDLFSGKRIITDFPVTAGQSDLLSYYRTWTYQADAVLSIQGAITTNGSVATVSMGARSEQFSVVGQWPYSYQPIEARGSTLSIGSAGYVYTTSDGTVYTFQRDNSCCQVVYRQWGDVPVIRSIKYKDGTSITYNWVSFQVTLGTSLVKVDIKRVASIYSNTGHALNLNYRNQAPSSNTDYEGATIIVGVSAKNMSLDNCTNVGVCAGSGNGYSTVIGYTTDGGWVNTDSANRTTTVTSSSFQAPGASASYAYDSANRVTSVTSRGITAKYGFSDSGDVRTVTVSTAGSPPRTLTFNIAQSTLRSDTDETNRTTSYDYDSSARVTKITAPETNYTTFGYDGRGNVTSNTVTGKDGATLSSSATFPCSIAAACNRPATTTDARNNITNYEYVPITGLPTKITAPADGNGARPEQRIGYTEIGGISRATSISQCRTATAGNCAGAGDEVKTTVRYTGNTGLPASVTVAAGDNSISATSTMTYDAMGYLLTIDGPLSGANDTTRYYYDRQGQLLGTVGPDPDGSGALRRRAVRNTYNEAGQTILVETGTTTDQSNSALATMTVLHSTITTYDSNSRPVAKSMTAGGATYAYQQTSYDARGRMDCVVTRMNPSAFANTGSACALGQQGNYGSDRINRTSYDDANRVVSVATGLNTAQAAAESTTYTANGRIASVTDGRNNQTTYEYDGFDRLSKTRYPVATVGASTSSTTDYEQLGYDAGSNVISGGCAMGRRSTTATMRWVDVPTTIIPVIMSPRLTRPTATTCSATCYGRRIRTGGTRPTNTTRWGGRPGSRAMSMATRCNMIWPDGPRVRPGTTGSS